jgi:hypothetical protein
MEKVLVVAKTHMGKDKACVGGLSLQTFKGVRLLLPGNHNHPTDTSFDVGQVWNLNLRHSNQCTPPHVEDAIIHAQKQIGQQSNIRGKLLQHIEPWRGGLTQLFDGRLQGERDKCFITRKGGLPSCSTGYWLTTLPLTLTYIREKAYYTIHSVVHKEQDYYRATFSIAYVGFAEPLPELPANTLIRVSLCRWWRREEYEEEKCYLQISGWYL